MGTLRSYCLPCTVGYFDPAGGDFSADLANDGCDCGLAHRSGVRMDNAATLTVISGMVIALFSFVVAILTWRSSATKEELNSLRQTIDLLQRENERLRKRLDDLDFENGALKEWAEALVCQVREMGGIPVRFDEKTRPRGLG